MNIIALKTYFFTELKSIQEDSEIESFFYILTEYLHQLQRIDIVLNPDIEISEDDLKKWKTIISELQSEKPIQYITGESWFYGYRFEVNENTLIPRPETEELVEWIVESTKLEVRSRKFSILDIGTGSGCIPISLKKEIPTADVFAIDVSENAIETAKINAINNDVEVHFVLQNILEVNNFEELTASNSQLPAPSSQLPASSFLLPASFDIIVSNPPYVRNLEKEEIKKNVLEYEPHLALFVEDNDALLFYRKIAQLALTGLKPNGKLFFEINQYLGKETVELLENLGFKNIELRKDFVGNDRMICCQI